MTRLDQLKIKIFADGADLKIMEAQAQNPLINGFTTNPTILRKAGITNYEAFARNAAQLVSPKPISFEVFSDDMDGIEHQARVIASWGINANVKIPVTNTKGEFTGPVIERLIGNGIKVNVTAVFTWEQVDKLWDILRNSYIGNYVSIFAGRIADLGIDPTFLVSQVSVSQCFETIWASPREIFNVWQANEVGCKIITLTSELLAKLEQIDKTPEQFSLETVTQFYNDAQKAGYAIAHSNSFGGGGFG